MINKTHPIAQQLIKTALEQTQLLHQQLIEEALVLKKQTQVDTLNSITLEKNKIISQLSTFTEQIDQILASEKLDKKTGMDQYFSLASHAGIDTSESSQNWQKLRTLSKKCQLLNEENGASIHILSQHTQRILDILKGKPQEINTYSRDGQAKTDSGSRSLTSV